MCVVCKDKPPESKECATQSDGVCVCVCWSIVSSSSSSSSSSSVLLLSFSFLCCPCYNLWCPYVNFLTSSLFQLLDSSILVSHLACRAVLQCVTSKRVLVRLLISPPPPHHAPADPPPPKFVSQPGPENPRRDALPMCVLLELLGTKKKLMPGKGVERLLPKKIWKGKGIFLRSPICPKTHLINVLCLLMSVLWMSYDCFWYVCKTSVRQT